MRTDYRRWHTSRLGREMGVVVYGHWGTPLLVFPTSGGDEREMEGQGMIGALGVYFNNPVDYLGGMQDPAEIGRISACRIHLATGHGPWENSGPTYHLASVLASKGIPHRVDDWGPMGGHDWPFWQHQMREYVKGL